MKEKSIISAIREYFEKQNILKDKKVNIDFIKNNTNEYIIEPVPIEPIYKQYVDGRAIRQYVFQFSSLNYLTSEVINNLLNSEFYENFSKIIEENNKKGILPKIEGIQSIECLNIGTIENEEQNKAKYSIQMRILYYR